MGRIAGSAEFVIRAIGQGLSKLKKDTQDVGKAAKATQADYKLAEKNAAAFHNTQAKGVIGTANATKSFSKLRETMGGGGGIVGVYATLAANIFAVSAAFNALRSAAQLQQVMGGLEAAGNKLGLTYSVATAHIKNMADGMLSTEQAARSAAQVFSAGFKMDSLERMTKLSKDISIGLGRNMTDSMDRLSRGVIKLEPELLDELGIMTKINESNTIYAAKLHKNVGALTNFEKRQGFMNAVLAEGELKFGGLSDEVGNTTAYDKLAATFADLTKNIFGMFTGVFGPVANILSKTKLGLLGVGALFLSTIRSQILPGLDLAAEKSTKLAAKMQKSNSKDFRKLTPLLTDKNMNINDWAKDFEKGTVKAKEFKGAIKEIDYVIKEHVDANKAIAKTEWFKTGDSPKLIDQYKKNTTEIVRLSEIRQKAINIDIAQKTANAQSRAGTAIGQAGSGNVATGFGNLIGSVNDYRKAGDEAGKSTGILKTSAFGAAKGVQFLGAAFLRVLPWIGLIAVAFGVLSLAIKHFRGMDTKEYLAVETAFSDLNETIDASQKKMQEYRKTEESTFSSSMRAAQMLTIKSNAIAEISERYLTAIDSLRKYQDAEKLKGVGTKDENAALVFGKKRVNALADAGIGFQTQLGKAFAPLADSEAGKPLLGALGELNKWDSKAVNRELNKYRDQIKEAGKDQGKLAVIGEAMAAGLANDFGSMADAVSSFQNDVKAAGTAMSQFLTSAVDSTPYDDVVTKLNAVSNSLNTVKENAAKVGDDKWKDLLSGFTADMTQFMDINVVKSVELLNANDATVKVLQAQVDAHKQLSATEIMNLTLAKEGLKTRETVLNSLDKEFNKVKDLFTKAQERDRLAKSEIAILQARAQASAHINSLTGEGIRAQIKGQERITKIQIGNLEVQKSIFQQVLQKSKLNDDELLFLQKGSAELQRQGLIIERNNATRALDATARMKERLHGSEEERKSQMGQDRYNSDTEINNANESIRNQISLLDVKLKRADDIIGKQQQSAASEASLNSLLNQQNVLQQTILTAAETEAQVQEKNVENLQGTISTIQQIRDLYVSTARANKDINVILLGRKNTLAQELGDLQDIYTQQVINARNQGKSQLADIGKTKELALAEIGAGKANSAVAKEVNDLYDLRVDLQNKLTDATVEQLRVQEQLAILEKATFDTAKEGLEWQKEGLNNLNDELNASRAVQESALAIDATRRKIANRKMGIEDNSNVQKSEEIRVASLAYKLAVDEASVRKTIIMLEFELLKEQRRQLLENLKTRKATLLDFTNDAGAHLYDQTSLMIKELNASISSLESVDLNKTRDAKLGGVNQDVEQKRLESVLSRTFTGTGSPIVDFIAGIATQFKATSEAVQQDSATATASIAAGVIQTAKSDGENPATKAAREAFEAQAKKSVDLITALDSLRLVIEAQITAAANIPNASNTEADVPTTGMSANAKILVAAAQKIGTSALNLAKVISYETIGTFSPNKRGGKNNNHLGLIQFGKDEQTKYGIAIGQTFADQMDAVVKFLKDRGFKKGMGLLELYSTINAGGPSSRNWNKSDGNGTVRSHTAKLDRQHAASANRFLGGVANDNPAPVPQRAAMNIPTTNLPTKPSEGSYYPEPVKIPEKSLQALNDIPLSISDINLHVVEMNDNFDATVKSANAVDAAIAAIKPPPSQVALTIQSIVGSLNLAAEQFKALGPEGEVAAAFSAGMATLISGAQSASTNIKDALSHINDGTKDSLTSFQGYAQAAAQVFGVISQGIAVISQIVQSSASAKEAAIDREIAAEQKRDGKSVDSVAKIKALEAKKDAIARKAFNTNKKLMMAQAIIGAAAGVAQALGSLPFPANFIVAGITAAMGAAQLAIISGTQYQSSASSSTAAPAMPSTLTIGKRGDNVDLARNNSNVGGELGYLRGTSGTGSNSGNFAVGPGSAYGGPLPRGYGHSAFMVGEKGPEIIRPNVPVSVSPVNDNNSSRPLSVAFHVNAWDGESVETMLFDRRGDIIDMLRGAANESGGRFLENVNTNTLKKANKGGGRRI